MTKLEKKIAIIHSIANFVGIKIEIDQIVDGCVMYTIHPNAIYIPPFNRNDLPYILFLAVTKVWEIFNELPFSWRNFSKDATPLEVFYEGAFCREEVEFREKSHEIIMILNEAGCDLLDKKYQDVICIAKNRLASICKSDIDVIKAVDIGFKEDGYITFEWYKDKDNVISVSVDDRNIYYYAGFINGNAISDSLDYLDKKYDADLLCLRKLVNKVVFK